MITLYSSGCYNCKRLIERLNNTGIKYTISQDLTLIRQMGFDTVPILRVGDNYMTYKEAINWLKGEQNVSREI